MWGQPPPAVLRAQIERLQPVSAFLTIHAELNYAHHSLIFNSVSEVP